ncbi:MAG: PHP domain-containing protein [Eubacteriales bacterium]|nr:PHP domain-containing protein [Eubacteriales bacterium]
MIPIDLHTHTVASGHGTTDTIADLAKAAAAKGMTVLGISDHGPKTFCAGTPSYFRSLALSPRQRSGVRILCGAELNILNGGELDLSQDIQAGLDYVIVSMHRPPRRPASREENTADYLRALSQPCVRILGHCDNTQFPCDYEAIVRACETNHVIVEVNESSLMPGGYHQVPGVDTRENYRRLLTLCRERSLPVLLSSDSHGRSRIGEMPQCEQLVRELDYPEFLIVNHHLELLLRRK